MKKDRILFVELIRSRRLHRSQVIGALGLVLMEGLNSINVLQTVTEMRLHCSQFIGSVRTDWYGDKGLSLIIVALIATEIALL